MTDPTTQCPDRDCVEPYILGARRHVCRYRSLGGFTIDDPVTVEGRPVGVVRRLERLPGSGVAVFVGRPGQIVSTRYFAPQLRKDTTDG